MVPAGKDQLLFTNEGEQDLVQRQLELPANIGLIEGLQVDPNFFRRERSHPRSSLVMKRIGIIGPDSP